MRPTQCCAHTVQKVAMGDVCAGAATHVAELVSPPARLHAARGGAHTPHLGRTARTSAGCLPCASGASYHTSAGPNPYTGSNANCYCDNEPWNGRGSGAREYPEHTQVAYCGLFPDSSYSVKLTCDLIRVLYSFDYFVYVLKNLSVKIVKFAKVSTIVFVGELSSEYHRNKMFK